MTLLRELQTAGLRVAIATGDWRRHDSRSAVPAWLARGLGVTLEKFFGGTEDG